MQRVYLDQNKWIDLTRAQAGRKEEAHLVEVLEAAQQAVVSLTENFDLGTKEGRLMFGVLALAAEYELELRAERQADGIAAARRRQDEGRMLPGKKHIGRLPSPAPPSSPPSGALSPTASPSPSL